MNHYQPPAAYLPHQPPMLLLEQVIAVDADSAWCQVRVAPDGVLAPFLAAQGELPGWYALELMAQTTGVWSGWQQQQRGEQTMALGMLLGARDLTCQCATFPAGALLDIQVKLLVRDTQFGGFEATILCDGTPLAHGRINTYQPDQAALEQLFSSHAFSSHE